MIGVKILVIDDQLQHVIKLIGVNSEWEQNTIIALDLDWSTHNMRKKLYIKQLAMQICNRLEHTNFAPVIRSIYWVGPDLSFSSITELDLMKLT